MTTFQSENLLSRWVCVCVAVCSSLNICIVYGLNYSTNVLLIVKLQLTDCIIDGWYNISTKCRANVRFVCVRFLTFSCSFACHIVLCLAHTLSCFDGHAGNHALLAAVVVAAVSGRITIILQQFSFNDS